MRFHAGDGFDFGKSAKEWPSEERNLRELAMVSRKQAPDVNIAKPNDASLPRGKPPLMACSIVGDGSMGPPSLNIFSFQL
jgi:hypothetical protein